MNPRYVLVPILILGSMDAPMAMESGERLETKVGDSSLFYNQNDIDYICDELWDKKTLYKITKEKVRCEYTMLGLPFQPREFWEKHIDDQLVYLKNAIQELELLVVAPKYHHPLEYTDDARCEARAKHTACAKLGTYPEELEEKFEVAVWKILQNDYKITLNDFKTSLRSALLPTDIIYKAPLLMRFTNYFVPIYKFYYKKGSFTPYKTEKYPSAFEVAIGVPNEGVLVYEQKE